MISELSLNRSTGIPFCICISKEPEKNREAYKRVDVPVVYDRMCILGVHHEVK